MLCSRPAIPLSYAIGSPMIRRRVAGVAIGYNGFSGVFIVFKMRFPSRGGKPAGSKSLEVLYRNQEGISQLLVICT